MAPRTCASGGVAAVAAWKCRWIRPQRSEPAQWALNKPEISEAGRPASSAAGEYRLVVEAVREKSCRELLRPCRSAGRRKQTETQSISESELGAIRLTLNPETLHSITIRKPTMKPHDQHGRTLALAICLPLSAGAPSLDAALSQPFLFRRRALIYRGTPPFPNDLFLLRACAACASRGIGIQPRHPLRPARHAAHARPRHWARSSSPPDGSHGEAPRMASIARNRSTFDVQLSQKGTYKLAVANSGAVPPQLEGKKAKLRPGNWRTAENFAKGRAGPSNAEDLQEISQKPSKRMEVFDPPPPPPPPPPTSGNPTESVLKPTGPSGPLNWRLVYTTQRPCSPGDKPPRFVFCSTASRRRTWISA